jgi:glycosyltransferase involved in cell wall biosynthesis
MVEKVIMPAADRVISLSHVMTEDFRRFVKYPIDRVRTIYHGVSAKFRPERDPGRLAEVREEYGLPDRYFLFVGHLYPQKNFAVLARALARLGDRVPHRLLIAGRPRYKYGDDLALIDALGLRDRVQFLNYVPNDDLPAVYTLAECFVYPSLYESFGLAQLEAMACGCPVVGANAGAIPEVTGDAALLFDPHRPDRLAEALLTVATDRTVRQGMVERGLARAAEFTWDRTARETLAVFEELT